ncbi:MAG: flippase [candidate division WOR-3 bacterium]
MKTIKNFFLLFLGDGISYILLFVATIYLARVLQVAGFGQLSFAFAFFSFGSFLTNLGLVSVGTRDVAQYQPATHNLPINAYIRNVIILRQILSSITFIALLIIGLIIHKPNDVKLLIILYGLSLFPFAFILEWLFLGLEKMFYVSLQKVINSGIYLGLLLLLVRTPQQIKNVPIAFLIGNLSGALFLYFVYRTIKHQSEKHAQFSYNEDHGLAIKTMGQILKSALPIGLGAILIQFSQNFNIIFLGLVKNDVEVGIFSAANKLVFTILIIDRVFCNAVFPNIARHIAWHKQHIPSLLNQLQKLILMLSIPVCIGSVLVSSRLINLIYGLNYQKSIPVFQVLIWFLFFTMLNTIFTSVLIAERRNKAYVLAIAIGVFANVIFNLILVRLLGALGTAIALISAELITLIVLYLTVKPFINISFEIRHIIKPLIATAVMAVFIRLFWAKLPIVLLIVLAIFVYTIVMVLIKGIAKQDFSRYYNDIS